MTVRVNQLVVEGQSDLGNPAATTFAKGPIDQIVSVPPSRATLFQGLMTLVDHVTESVAVVGYVQGTKDVAAGSLQSIGGQFASSATKSAPSANTVTNIAVQGEASGGDENFSWFSQSGAMRQDGHASFGSTVQARSLDVNGTDPGTAFSVSTDRVVMETGTGNTTIKGEVTVESTFWAKFNTLGTYFGPDKSVYIGPGPTINAQHDVAALEHLDLNFWGYNHGWSQPRDLRVLDGMGGRCLDVIGSTKRAKFYGAIEAMGTLGDGPTWTSGAGAPGGTPPIGSLYSRTDGGALTSLYVYVGGVGWTGIA